MISFVLIGLWAIVGTVVGVMAGLLVTSSTDPGRAAPTNSRPVGGPDYSSRPHRGGERLLPVADAVAPRRRIPGISPWAAEQGEEGGLEPAEDR